MCLETERVNASGLSKPLGPQLHSSYCAAQDLFSLPSAMASNCLSAPKSTSGSHQGAPFLGKPPNFAPCLLPLRMSLHDRSLHSTLHKDPVSYTHPYPDVAASRTRALRDAEQPLTLASAHGKGDLKGQLVGLPIWRDAVCMILNTDGLLRWLRE